MNAGDDPIGLVHVAAALAAHVLERAEAGLDVPAGVFVLTQQAIPVRSQARTMSGEVFPPVLEVSHPRRVPLSKRTVARLAAEGALPAVKVGASSR